jgi:TolB-like protein/DNA-binding winged helix-turn-helix (wHTH) protein/Tfp pilus assembly protein PilF
MLLGSQKRLVRFGVFELDPASGELWKAGRRVKLQNQPRQVLRVLISRPGELVTREELRSELWPDDTFVDFDAGLNVAIRKIRQALGDLAPSPRFIETERALGYRFIAPIRVDPGPEAEESPLEAHRAGRSKRLLLLAAAALAIVAGTLWVRGPSTPQDSSAPITLAILPFRSLAGESEELLALGIPDSIITRLSSVSGFRVRPTTAVAEYQGAEVDAQAVGRELRSQYVLQGTIRPASDRLRVSVQLVRTSDGSPVWGRQYDRPRDDLLDIEDGVAEEIASALRVRMSEAERDRLYRRHTESGEAYERYLMGRARLRSFTEEDALQAIAEFESARDLDPDFALAHAGMATAASQLRVRFGSKKGHETWDARARQEAGRALHLDPDLAEAHLAIAAVHRFQEHDWETVIRESQRALELNGSLDTAHLFLATAWFHIGLLEEAEIEVDAALELNPGIRAEPLEVLGAILLFSGRTEEAATHLSRAHELTDSRIVRYLLGWTLFYRGERERAEALLESMMEDEGPLPGNARATLAALRAARGAEAEARALAERVASEVDLIHHGAYGLGSAYAQLRDPTTALRWLSQAATTGFPCFPWYERDPLLDPIRDDPRFRSFMRELRRSWENAGAKYGRGRQASSR